MTNNDVLRRLRYALGLSDAQMVQIFALADHQTSNSQVRALMGKEEDPGAVYCENEVLAAFLDGLILDRRGPRKPGAPPPPTESLLTNNAILKKIRIALTLQEQDLLGMLKLGGHPLSKGELTALFRKPEHKHFRACGDQIIRKFLVGLTHTLRPGAGGAPDAETVAE